MCSWKYPEPHWKHERHGKDRVSRISRSHTTRAHILARDPQRLSPRRPSVRAHPRSRAGPAHPSRGAARALARSWTAATQSARPSRWFRRCRGARCGAGKRVKLILDGTCAWCETGASHAHPFTRSHATSCTPHHSPPRHAVSIVTNSIRRGHGSTGRMCSPRP